MKGKLEENIRYSCVRVCVYSYTWCAKSEGGKCRIFLFYGPTYDLRTVDFMDQHFLTSYDAIEYSKDMHTLTTNC